MDSCLTVGGSQWIMGAGDITWFIIQHVTLCGVAEPLGSSFIVCQWHIVSGLTFGSMLVGIHGQGRTSRPELPKPPSPKSPMHRPSRDTWDVHLAFGTAARHERRVRRITIEEANDLFCDLQVRSRRVCSKSTSSDRSELSSCSTDLALTTMDSLTIPSR